jgi:hypothetical protein
MEKGSAAQEVVVDWSRTEDRASVSTQVGDTDTVIREGGEVVENTAVHGL